MRGTFKEDPEAHELRNPKTHYRNKASWELAQMATGLSIPKWMSSGLIICMFIAAHDIYYERAPARSWHRQQLYNVLLSSFAMLFESPYQKIKRTIKLQMEQLCREVLEGNPGMQIEQWDLVAQRLNDFLHAEGHWPVTNPLFDGHMCHSLFRKLVVHPVNKKLLATRVQRATVDAREGELSTRTSAASEPAKDTIACYESGMREWWARNAKPEKQEGIDVACRKLPKEVVWSKVGWQFSVAMAALVQTRAFIPISFLSFIGLGTVYSIDTIFRLTLVVLSNVFWGIILSPALRDTDVNARDLMELWATIVAVEPRGDTSEWDRVASHMNKYLVTASAAGRAAQFYDGENCMQRFKKRYSASLLPKEGQVDARFEDLRPYIEAAMDAASED